VNGILVSESVPPRGDLLLKSHSPIDNVKDFFVKCRLLEVVVGWWWWNSPERGKRLQRAEGGIHASCEEEGGQEVACEDGVKGKEEGPGQEEEGPGQAQVGNTFTATTLEENKRGFASRRTSGGQD
jgi:hypothetical protein